MKSSFPALIGYACGMAAGDSGCADAAPHLFQKYYPAYKNKKLLYPIEKENKKNKPDKYAVIADLCTRLSKETAYCVEQETFFTVIAGDHSCGIGTWSGVAHTLQTKGECGLIWIDAHLDAHTPQTTPSGNIHGMPVAVLLGYGDQTLIHIQDNFPKIKPENLCMIGIRSYESAENDLIHKLNIRVFYIEEVLQRGFEAVFAEARDIVTRNTAGYGISLDMDGIDPADAPAVGTPAENGIPGKDVYDTFQKYCLSDLDQKTKKLIGLEITEFNPHRDKEHKTEKLILKLLSLFYPRWN